MNPIGTEPTLRALGDKVQSLMAQYSVPGVAVGILHGGQETLAGYGVTNINHPLPVDADTLFQIGSTTKTFTATLAMMLVEQGKLDLDAPIRSYLPAFQLQDGEATAHATLRHCFTHTGGWLGDFFIDTGDGDGAAWRYVQAMADNPQFTPLGQVWSYNNAGFAVAGAVIEAVTGQAYEQLVHDRIFAPLGMDHSFFFAKEAIVHRTAVGHIVDSADKIEVAQPWALARNAHAMGGIVSSARDQLRYARFHLGNGVDSAGNSLLSQQNLHDMQSPLAAAGTMADQVGVSWMLHPISGVQTVGHGGATNGQLSAFLMAPERDFAITVLTNANRGRELHGKLVNWALANYAGLVDAEPVQQERSAAELAAYAGYYVAQLSHVDVSVDGEQLHVKTIPQGGFPDVSSPPGPTPAPSNMVFIGADDLYFVSGPAQGGYAKVLRAPNGSVAYLRMGGRIHRRQ